LALTMVLAAKTVERRVKMEVFMLVNGGRKCVVVGRIGRVMQMLRFDVRDCEHKRISSCGLQFYQLGIFPKVHTLNTEFKKLLQVIHTLCDYFDYFIRQSKRSLFYYSLKRGKAV
jgi:hypothetical protein